MKTNLFILLITLSTSLSYSQVRVALHHVGTTTIFGGTTPFIDAYNASVDGDTIYLPGSQFNPPTLFDKRLAVFGAGIHTDSTLATNRTIVDGTFNIGSNADKSHLEGIYFNGVVSFAANQSIDSIYLRRNYMNSLSITGTNPANRSNGVKVTENFIGGAINLQNCTNVEVQNNVFYGLNNVSSNGWFANNIITGQTMTYTFNSVSESLFENNIINSSIYSYGITAVNCTFLKNAFVNDPTSQLNNNWSGNYVNITWPPFFMNYQSSAIFSTANYHLSDPASYQGTTGNQIGVYGGVSPMKEGVVPFNPHISTKTIAPQTDSNGDLNINITVGAQEN
jgi:hypothetical protein